jgi:rod shape-determining protein MreC
MANGTWRIARTRNSAQLPLILSAVLAVLLLVAGKAHFGPFERARTAITDKAAPALQAMNVPVVAATRWAGGVRHFFDVYSENQRLREENARLLQWHSAAVTLQTQIRRYQLLLKTVPDPSYSAVTAKVIARSSQPFLETIVLNAGRREGVKPGQAVVDARGLVGRIYVAGEHTSWVIVLNDLNSRVPVLIRPGNVQAILTGTNATEPNLEALPQNAKVKNGEEVVTSGDGGLLPPGLPVGLVAASGGDTKAAPFADPLTAGEVRILNFTSPIEQMPKPSDQDLPAPPARPPPPEASAMQQPSAAKGNTQTTQTVHTVTSPAAASARPVRTAPHPVRHVIQPETKPADQAREPDDTTPNPPDDQNNQ